MLPKTTKPSNKILKMFFKNKKLLIVTQTLLILLIFALSSCVFINPSDNSKNSGATDIFKTPSILKKIDPHEKYNDFLYSNPKSKSFYEEAYDLAVYQRSISKQVFGGILPNNPDLAPEIASYFHRLAKKGLETETVVIIAQNYGITNKNSKVLTKLPYETPYGLLEPDLETINTLLEKWMAFEKADTFKQEKAIAFITPFIKKTFPNAKIVPIILEGALEEGDAEILGEFLAKKTKHKNTIVLAISNFSNHPQYDLARFQTRYAKSIIEEGKFSDLKYLNLDAQNTVYALSAFLRQNIAHTAISHLKGMKNRGYLMEYFTSGSPRPAPEVTLIGVGDIMVDRYVRTLMGKNTEDYPFEKIATQGLFQSAHIKLANLEGPIADERPRKGNMIFKFDTNIIEILKKQGINLVTIANNHTLDQKQKGFEDTKRHLDEANFAWFGHPLNKTEGHVYIKKINGLKLGFIGYHDATIRMNLDQAIKDIESIRPLVDTLIVAIHWGNEYKFHSSTRQQEIAHKFIDAGVDTIIGHHPHVVQEIEWYKEKPIIYSLGNFIFDQYWSKKTQKGLAVGLIFSPNKVELYNFPIKLPKSQPELVISDD